ncbi:MAG: MotA/TolQ/ExbB proton channel family protein [Verrucomicrobia bacterium]|nr:MotA/TolQ/ExbB proton channel family protein [Verrucomicrobiota bacterium]MDE3098074.1 MotA/TolQ/ExbB proton channel family protein [Verrucomicrobiota bacterium]
MDELVYILLGLTSITGLAFIIERGWTLRWDKVAPRIIADAVEACRSADGVNVLRQICETRPSPLGRLLLLASARLDWPKADNADALQTAARHEIVRLERGLVVLEIIVGIAPLLGLVGTIAGMMTLFGDIGVSGLNDAARLAKGIALILNATLIGLLIAIPSLIAWSYFSKKVEVLAAEMEAICDDFIRRMYSARADEMKTVKDAVAPPVAAPPPVAVPPPLPAPRSGAGRGKRPEAAR